jgi:hypothetical protein
VVKYHGLVRRHLLAPRFLMRPPLNGGTLARLGTTKPMAEDPQTLGLRRPPVRTIIHGHTSLTVLGWSIWALTFVFAALVSIVESTRFLAAAAIVTLGAVSMLLLVRRRAQRVHWIFVLDNDQLSIERVPPRDVGTQHLDVHAGVHIDVVADKRILQLDAAVALQTANRRTLWSPGIQPAQAIAHLVKFLHDNDVPVTLPPDAPLGWFPPNYPNIG